MSGISIGDVIGGVAVWYIFDKFFVEKPKKEEFVEREYSRGATTYAGSPWMITKLKDVLLGQGVEPVITDLKDPARTEGELMQQITKMGMTKRVSPSNEIGQDRGSNSRGALLVCYNGLMRHQGDLKGAPEPDGN
jgi:hypothetical protein